MMINDTNIFRQILTWTEIDTEAMNKNLAEGYSVLKIISDMIKIENPNKPLAYYP